MRKTIILLAGLFVVAVGAVCVVLLRSDTFSVRAKEDTVYETTEAFGENRVRHTDTELNDPTSATTETTANYLTAEEAEKIRESEEKVSIQNAETAEMISSLFYSAELREDVDMEKMLRSVISDRKYDIFILETDYEEFRRKNKKEYSASYAEQIEALNATVEKYEEILADYTAGQIDRNEAFRRYQDVFFDSVIGFDIYDTIK